VRLDANHATLHRLAEHTYGAKRLEKLRENGQYIEVHWVTYPNGHNPASAPRFGVQGATLHIVL
jgi:hypothetical protein